MIDPFHPDYVEAFPGFEPNFLPPGLPEKMWDHYAWFMEKNQTVCTKLALVRTRICREFNDSYQIRRADVPGRLLMNNSKHHFVRDRRWLSPNQIEFDAFYFRDVLQALESRKDPEFIAKHAYCPEVGRYFGFVYGENYAYLYNPRCTGHWNRVLFTPITYEAIDALAEQMRKRVDKVERDLAAAAAKRYVSGVDKTPL